MDTKRYNIIFFDVGHTLCWPDLQGMAEMATKILGRHVTQAQLARGDCEARRVINGYVAEHGHASTMPSPSGMPSSVAACYFAIINMGIDRADEIPTITFQDLMDAWWQRQRTKNWYTVLGPDVVPALDALRRDGWRLGVISNSEGRVRQLLSYLGIREYFDVLVDSGVEGVAKPDPAIFRLAMERAGVASSRCLYVGDQPDVDVKAARAVGMDVIHYDPQGVFADFSAYGVPRCTNLLSVADGSLVRQMTVDAARTL